MVRPLPLLLVLPLTLRGLGGCGDDSTLLTVAAASSLSEPFSELERRFERAHPQVDVVLVTAGSHTLATQLRAGLRADVFASADPALVETLVDEGRLEGPQTFATNTLVLGQPETAAPLSLARLGEARRLVLGVPEVPLGRYTDALLTAATARYGAAWREEVEAAVVSRESNARLVVSKLGLGVADAAVVYLSDLEGRDGLVARPLPPGLAPAACYVQGLVTGTAQRPLAAEWTAMVMSPDGSAVLAAHGLGMP